MTIIILAAGKGERAKKVTGDCPKQLYFVPFQPAMFHILNFVEPLNSEVRIVTNPEHREIFDAYCGGSKTIVTIKDSGGEAESVFSAIHDLRFSQTPVLILLGDQIPIGDSAKAFQGLFADTLPTDNVIATRPQRDIKNGTWVKICNNTIKGDPCFIPASSKIYEFVEVRGDYAVPSVNYERSGFDFIKRADLLYEAIRKMIAYKHTVAGEYRLSTAYQFMLSRGAVFDSAPIRYLSVGDPDNIKKTSDFFERINDYD